uniref:CCHC-type domain-containing protein n=1 Tax=Chenopodium quinoa TaxID=63459 RepID=A0A803LFW0_CHEQI
MSTLTKKDLDTMLVDMMRNFNANLERINEKIEKSTQEIAQTNQRVETLSTQVVGEGRIINNEQPRGIMSNFPIDNDRDLKLLELPEFTGDGDAEDFLDWVRQMEKVFDYKGFDEQKAYKSLSVSEYTKEFEKLCMLCDLQEKEEMKIGRYIKGLTPSISHKVETSNYVFFDDVLRLAERFEKQEKEKKTSYFKERKSFFNGEGSNHNSAPNSNNSNNEGKMIVVTPEQAALAKKVCFKCQGMGHIARDCGNKVTVSKKEHRMLLAYLDQEEKEKESTCLLNTEEEFDFEEFEGQEKITPEPEHHHI